jgi:hypothetical protein
MVGIIAICFFLFWVTFLFMFGPRRSSERDGGRDEMPASLSGWAGVANMMTAITTGTAARTVISALAVETELSRKALAGGDFDRDDWECGVPCCPVVTIMPWSATKER